ncbi:ELAV-like protein 1-B [Sycon ciliatum]|uniref:ELAV-like protein 1-B n=1 Tax=Sycon ciliatum TaxID=27933 RepID=UPI0020ABD5B1|eukprot:scpid85800/ scgid29174/ ELAV-like protein 1; Elav-like generic protein; Hu-antigen R; MelG
MDPADSTNLIVNYLPQTMTQEELRSLFATIGPVKSCKLIRNKTTGQSLAFGFVDYETALDAKKAIQTLNGLVMQTKTVKVSYARPSSAAIKNANLYISGLPPSFSQEALDELFNPYGHIITSKVVVDNDTGLGKGIAFVRYDQNQQAVDAITGLNQATPAGCHGPITVKYANAPKTAAQQGGNSPMPPISVPTGAIPVVGGQSAISTVTPQQRRGAVNSGVGGPMRHAQASYRYSPLGNAHSNHQDPMGLAGFSAAAQTAAAATGGQNGWCLFVYNIPEEAEEAMLYQTFGPYGAILSVKVIKDYGTGKSKGYGFVTMVNYEEAYNAIVALNGQMLNGKPLQVSFKTSKNA